MQCLPAAFVVERVKSINKRTVVCDCISHGGLPGVRFGTRCLVHMRREIVIGTNSCSSTLLFKRWCFRESTLAASTSQWLELAPIMNDHHHHHRIMVLNLSASSSLLRNRRGDVVIDADDVHAILFEGLDEKEWVDADASAKELQSIKEDNNMLADKISSPQRDSIQPKSDRHRIFAQWLVHQYGIDTLRKGSGVLDVAGGNGLLCSALSQMGVPCILLDPQPRLPDSIDRVTVLPMALYGDGTELQADDEVLRLVAQCSIVTGMHPDQATEPIVDTALRLCKPFAIVPCCVMPKLFPDRLQKCGDPVRSYSAFCKYLVDKVAAAHQGEALAERCYLPFQGRNLVIFTEKKLR